MGNALLEFWIKKYTPDIISYINTVVDFQELTPEDLEKRRKDLLLEFMDSSDSSFLPYLLSKHPDFLDRLYSAIYKIDEGVTQ